jgi:hypothetical protein
MTLYIGYAIDVLEIGTVAAACFAKGDGML